MAPSGVTERILCLDTNVLIKSLAPDEQEEAATRLVDSGLHSDVALVSPTWAWAEIGSVLRKKIRTGLLEVNEGVALWEAFLKLPITYIDSAELRIRSWEIADRYGLPTLYDAAFLACTEVATSTETARREFWTDDRRLLANLGADRPSYVRLLGDDWTGLLR